MAKKISPEKLELRKTKDFFDCISAGVVRFLTDHYIVGNSYRCAWAVREYPPSTEEQVEELAKQGFLMDGHVPSVHYGRDGE